jgi:hypothetical protein
MLLRSDKVIEMETVEKKKKPKEDLDDVPGLIQIAQSVKATADTIKKAREGQTVAQREALRAQVKNLKEETAAIKDVVELSKEKAALELELAKQKLIPIGGTKVFQGLRFSTLVRNTKRQANSEVIEAPDKRLILLHYNDKKGERWYEARPLFGFRWKLTGITKETYESLKNAIKV